MKGTRVDIIRQIQLWAESPDSPNILLLTGSAGTGKSTITRTIAEELEKEGRLGCYIRFKRGRTNSSTITNTVIRTIAYNLAKKNSIITEYILKAATSNEWSSLPSATILFQDFLHVPLCSAVEKGLSEPVVIVLDALDECGSLEAQKELASFLEDKVSTLPPVFRFLVTSRPEEGISSMSPFCNHSILDHTSTSSKEDVIKFVRHEMRELRKDGGWHVPKDWPWDENIQALGEAADEIFIWASTAVRYISERKSGQFEHLKRLKENSSIVNKSLFGLYATIFEDSLDWDDNTKGRFQRILSMILFGKRLLIDEEIDDFLESAIGTTWDLLSCLQSVVTCEKDKPIRIHHASLYDYLIFPDSVGLGWHIDEEEGKKHIALYYFKRMRKQLRFNICELETSFAMDKDVLQLQECVQKNIPPFLQYVCQNWALHIRDVPYSERPYKYLRHFAYNTSLYWVEALSLTGGLYIYLGPALEIAIKWIDVSSPLLEYIQNLTVK